MERSSFYHTKPFVFDIVKDFDTLFDTLAEDEIDFFRFDEIVQQNVQKAFVVFLRLSTGFILDNDIGLLQVEIPANFSKLCQPMKIYRMMVFLHQIRQNFLAQLFLLIVCRYHKRFIQKNWLQTQSFLKPYAKTFNPFEQKPPLPQTPFRALSYENNSCYTDTVLMALFLVPNKFITTHILHAKPEKNRQDVQHELKRIVSFIRGDKTDHRHKYCTTLRKAFKNCKGSQPFHGTGTQDAGEFLMYLFNMFEMLDVSQNKVYIYGANTIKEKFTNVNYREDSASPIVSIVETTLEKLDQTKTYAITEFMRQIDIAKFDKESTWKPKKDVQYLYRKEITKRVMKVPFVVFEVKRSFKDHRGRDKFRETKMYPPETMFMPSYKSLNLSAIVIHNGGAHYTALLKREDIWYYYNDMGTVLKRIGTYEEMLESKPNPLTHGTLYFYN